MLQGPASPPPATLICHRHLLNNCFSAVGPLRAALTCSINSLFLCTFVSVAEEKSSSRGHTEPRGRGSAAARPWQCRAPGTHRGAGSRDTLGGSAAASSSWLPPVAVAFKAGSAWQNICAEILQKVQGGKEYKTLAALWRGHWGSSPHHSLLPAWPSCPSSRSLPAPAAASCPTARFNEVSVIKPECGAAQRCQLRAAALREQREAGQGLGGAQTVG